MNQLAFNETYRGPNIPRPLGEQLRRVLALEDRPRVFAEWVAALKAIADRDGFDLDVDALCTTGESPHRAQIGGATTYYRCVQDPIVVPFLTDDVDAVEIETISPGSRHPIELTVTTAGIESRPADAVFSYGVDASVDGPPDEGVSPGYAYPLFCPYGHAFPSYEAYWEWAEEVDAFTMAATTRDTFEWARALGRSANEST